MWWKEATAYQVYPRSFMDASGDGIGDLKGVTSKLDYLKDLGIDLIWISPFYKSPNDDYGYDISDYQDIMDEFGTMADFDELLAEAHKRGIKVIGDLVINHSSDEHPWFIESRSSFDNPKRDWYIWRDPRNGEEPNNWESIFRGSAWEYDEATKQYYMHLFSKKQPDLNWENPVVRQELYKMINWWLDKGLDGFRIDAISHIKKEDGFPDMPNPENMEFVSSFDKHMNVDGIQPFLQELKEETFAKYDVVTVGEANGVSIDGALEWVGAEKGKFNMIFQFEHVHLWRESIAEKNIAGLKEVLTRWQDGLEGMGWNALYIENHDLARAVSTLGDQVNYWKESAKSLAVMYFFMKGTPFIYQGQEIGMTNCYFETIEEYGDLHSVSNYRELLKQGKPVDEALEIIRATTRGNSRTPMQWDDTDFGGFSTSDTWIGMNPNYSQINVNQQLADPDSILNFYKAMIQLRKSDELYIHGVYELIAPDHPAVYAYTRTLDDKKAVIVANLTGESQEVSLDGLQVESKKMKLANYDVSEHDLLGILQLRPFEARIYEVRG